MYQTQSQEYRVDVEVDVQRVLQNLFYTWDQQCLKKLLPDWIDMAEPSKFHQYPYRDYRKKATPSENLYARPEWWPVRARHCNPSDYRYTHVERVYVAEALFRLRGRGSTWIPRLECSSYRTIRAIAGVQDASHPIWGTWMEIHRIIGVEEQFYQDNPQYTGKLHTLVLCYPPS
ncbi:uncharacterized protein BDZ99DRAFT_176727 [Mytilinidion resinicola]|uniref:Subtelomeric hrmA-associated cluster protein AFUB-079030/YDR124W-like helical bundle domain-containing protein n=1 Tax=Mytilinidion resinicola TaxID=574789 RepID=A0A6A6Y4C9_9PEZI|nr:uncharacterized protein BDZ99DRAFT_176727 [Mytilinidion resinicola]KAF2802884.1 hypothetical protein BDZ99DRAFT_176727 [Mytilinidion resinicola]